MMARKKVDDVGTSNHNTYSDEERTTTTMTTGHHKDLEDGGRSDENMIEDTETIPLTPVSKKNADPSDSVGTGTSGVVADAPKVLMVLVFQIGNIMLWYWTNGMNGISMQSYAEIVDDPTRFASPTLRFLSTMALTGIVTCLQLMLGALIGRILLSMLNPSITWHHITATHSPPLSGLHALGSIATNVGFMYGKASVIQVIKLLEPFETLILQQLLFREAKCSIGIFSSITVVIGAAMSLLKLQSSPPHPLSIFFAILSGLTLSCRNVLQRKHHSQPQSSSSSSSFRGMGGGGKDASSISPPPPLGQLLPPPPTATPKSQWSKLEKSVVQFTQLSFYSGLWTGGCALVLYVMIRPYLVPCSYQVLLWHPLYNIFSMITLGFCSALTHSLLNAGKRVFAICMAMLWFHEGLYNPATLAGLAGVALGGTWYTLETKRKETPPRPEYDKLARCVVGLGALLWFQNMYK